MSKSMIEYVARGIAESGGSNWQFCLDASGQHMAMMYRSMARTAIIALTEPTEAMISAGDKAANNDGEQIIAIWKAMIDAALGK